MFSVRVCGVLEQIDDHLKEAKKSKETRSVQSEWGPRSCRMLAGPSACPVFLRSRRLPHPPPHESAAWEKQEKCNFIQSRETLGSATEFAGVPCMLALHTSRRRASPRISCSEPGHALYGDYRDFAPSLPHPRKGAPSLLCHCTLGPVPGGFCSVPLFLCLRL